MPSTFLRVLTTQPLTCSLVTSMSLLFFFMWNRRVDYDAVSISYRRVILEGQYYRVLTAAVCHLDVMHILFNMGSLLSVGIVEAAFGTLWYAETTALLLLSSKAVWLLILHIGMQRFGRAAWVDAPAVGYSGVIFGWMTVLGLMQPGSSMWGLPLTFAPFFSLLLTQLIVRRASFLGHLAGIFAGYAVGWGLLDWVRGYWLCVALGVFVCVAAFSLARALPQPRGGGGGAVAACFSRVLVLSPELIADFGGAPAPTGLRSRVEASGQVRQWREVGPEDIVVAPMALPAALAVRGEEGVARAPPSQALAQAQGQQTREQGLRSGAASVPMPRRSAPPSPQPPQQARAGTSVAAGSDSEREPLV